ncbi:MAG: hypothetical protein IT427_20175 [Pirellulales bacterium]|nr:hypothetical protein [Pirellulales bacterium]
MFGGKQTREVLNLTLSIVLGVVVSSPAAAQLLRSRLRPPPTPIEALAGQPYGVGKWTLELPPGVSPALLGNSGFVLQEKDGRVSYQAFEAMPLRTAARELLGRPQLATVYFLFTGNEPLNLTLYAPTALSGTVVPRTDAAAHDPLLSQWWVQYARQTNRIDRAVDYPDIVDDYLLAMLSRRFNLPPASQIPPSPVRLLADRLTSAIGGSAISLPNSNRSESMLDQQAAMLLGSDGLRSALHAQVMARADGPAPQADQPLPAKLDFAAHVPEALGEVAIEPLANHVPAECFYVRFGSFSNYHWFRTTMDRWAGDLQNLVSRRALNFGLSARIERQLSLQESALAQLLGPAVVADVAMIGTDAFFREGASIGMLFQARNNFALSTDFSSQRAAALKNVPGCTEEKIEIAGHQVSFLSTPDNRVRSFYAADGDFHFVTNSRTLVKRFFESSAEKDSLGSTAEYRFARSLMPIDRGDSVFAYLSGEFLNNLVSPHYQVEMMRRARSAAEIDMALVAKLTAHAEGQADKSLKDLVAGGYLPAGFGTRPDGSELEMTAEGNFVDSLRGGRGSFAPVPDIEFERITPAESQQYEQFSQWLRSKWGQLDPIVAGIRRQPSTMPATEHLVLDALLTPMAVKSFEKLAAMLGPIQMQRIAPIPGDIAAGQIVLSGNFVSNQAPTPPGPSRLFGAIRDAEPTPAAVPPANAPLGAASQIRINGRPLLDGLPAGGPLGSLIGGISQPPTALLPPFYFGSYPHGAIFDKLGLGRVPLDAAGYGRGSLGLWLRRVGSFTFTSSDRALLEIVPPQVKYVDASRPAQAWIQIGDLGGSKPAGTINGIFYQLSKNATIGNLRFLHSLMTQLRVPPPEALAVAEQLTDTKLISSLGGEFQLEQKAGGWPTWVSTVLPADRMRLIDGLFEPAPAGFTAPILQWLRGLSADLALEGRTLSLHAEIEMQMAEPVTGQSAVTPHTSLQLPRLPALIAPTKPQPAKKPEPKPDEAEELPPPEPRPIGK